MTCKQMGDQRNLKMRSYSGTESDRILGSQLVREYVQATAEEMGWEPQALIPYVTEYYEFPGQYAHPGDFLFAEVDGLPAGCVGITPGQHGLCEMNRLWVRPEYRAYGLGHKLVEASLSRAAELGYTRMGLDVLPIRERAIALYLRAGFARCRPFHEYEFEMVGLERSLKGATQTLGPTEVTR